jgi:hypothetical protein
MYGLTRGAMTLVGVIVAGFLIWLGADALGGESISEGEFWWAVSMCALAGLVMAVSQLLGGWTKWGWPRISLNVFLLAFLPALIVGGWVLLYAQPESGPLAGDIRDWSNDLGIDGVLDDLAIASLAVSFAVGLVFGLTFDTTGPVVRRRDEEVAPVDTTPDRDPTVDRDPDTVRNADTVRDEETVTEADDDRRVRIKEGARSE